MGYKIVLIVFYSCLFFCLMSCGKEQAADPCGVYEQEETVISTCIPQIISYTFGLEKYSIPEQLSLIKSIGVEGLFIQIESSNFQELNQYLSLIHI